MNHWNQMPLFRLLFPFIAGILFAVYSGILFSFSSLFFLSLFLFLIISLFTFTNKISSNYRFRWLYGTMLNVMFFVLGYQLTVLKTEKNDAQHFSNISPKATVALAYLDEPLKEKSSSYKTVLQIYAEKIDDKWIDTKGKVLVYFEKDSSANQLQYGDVIMLKANYHNEVHPPQNPSEFNYKRYLSFHSVYHQSYLKSTDWKKTTENKGNIVIRYAISLREQLLTIFKQNNISGEEYAVISALILGYTDEIDAHLIGAYSSAGAMHILSVSGLHVGIIYVVLNAMLFFLNRNRSTRIIKAIILILFLWGYAVLTGLSPAVLRSAAMLSFVVIGQSLNRNTNIYNTLATSVLVLLLFNPYLIMEVGFQLSYLAVLGIVLIHPAIYKHWEAPNWLLRQIWGIISVSIAAQLATFPLALLYFHQFPNYFLVSNLLVIPLSTLIIYAGILLMAVSSFAMLADIIGRTENHLVHYLNQIVYSVEHLPYSMLKGIAITVTETWIVYFIMTFLFIYLLNKRIRYLYIGLSLTIVFLSFQFMESIEQRQQKKFIVYAVPKTVAYDFIDGKKEVFIADSSLLNNDSKIQFHIRNNWWNVGINNTKWIETKTISAAAPLQSSLTNELFIQNNFIQFYDKTIVVINDKKQLENVSLEKKIKVDVVILSKNVSAKVEKVLSLFDAQHIIIDSSNSQRKTEKWLTECKQLKVNCYAVLNSGAFQMEL